MKKMIHKPYDKFRGFLRENRLTYEDVAKALGISTVSVGTKINGKSDFYLKEIQTIIKTFNTTFDIFL